MNGTNVLIVGGGGREHALAWKLAQSPQIGKLYIAPGNGGTRNVGENVPIPAADIDSLLRFAKEKEIGLTVIGPDDVLALGIVDAFQAEGLKVFGPTKSAAQIESSKAFAKKMMKDAGIPTAEFKVFTKYDDALAYVKEKDAPIVVKASGLALGKGAYVCKTVEEAEAALEEIMKKRVHKNAGDEVVIEEFLEGPEISVHALSDGENFLIFPPAQDHKQAGENDTGKNTGGMGTIAPLPWVGPQEMENISKQIVRPAINAMDAKGAPFKGLLFPGLKMTKDGPKVLEFNARFGDPETQAYMRLLKPDLLDILEACADGKLTGKKIEWNSGFAVNIVLASGGYPDAYKKGFPITGIEEAEKVPGIVVFHSGTKCDEASPHRILTAGGRVLGISAVGSTLRQALDRAYAAVSCIEFEGNYYRKDIGAKSLKL